MIKKLYIILFFLFIPIVCFAQIPEMTEEYLPSLNQQLQRLEDRINTATDNFNEEIDLTTEVTGVLPVENGGMGSDLSSASIGDMLYFDGSDWVVLSAGTAQQDFSDLGIPCAESFDGADDSTPATLCGVSATYGIGDWALDTSEYKFPTASGHNDGSSTNDWVTLADKADWDICGSSSDDETISFWMNFTRDGGTTVFIEQYEDNNNNWWIGHTDSATGLLFRYLFGGGDHVKVSTSGYQEIDSAWHHYALIKDGSKYGLFYDGTQIGYTDDSSTDTLAGAFYIASAEPALQGTAYTSDEKIDSLLWTQYNHFVDPNTNVYTVPNAGLTAEITVPTDEERSLDVPIGQRLMSNGAAAPSWENVY